VTKADVTPGAVGNLSKSPHGPTPVKQTLTDA